MTPSYIKKISLLIILGLVQFLGYTQQLSIDVNQQLSTSNFSVNAYDPATVGSKKVSLLSYTDISGSPYWTDNWLSALFFMHNGKIYQINKARLNLFTGEVHFLNLENEELAVEANQLDSIIFKNSKDSTKVLATFKSLYDPTKNAKSFYQTLNSGENQLLLLKKYFIKTGDYNALQGKTESSFYQKTSYGIFHYGMLDLVESLDQKNICTALNVSDEIKNWLGANKNKLRNEKEVITFLTYLNSTH